MKFLFKKPLLVVLLTGFSFYNVTFAGEMCKNVFAGPETPNIQEIENKAKELQEKINQKHQQITETLYLGNVVAAKTFSANENRNALWLVTLKNPKNGNIIKALFKPRPYGHGLS